MRASNLDGVERLVFVCHGNICRSAFAEGFAQARGWPAASFGLSTSPGRPAHPPVQLAAQEHGIDLNAHLSTPLQTFEPRPGDLYLVMEARQVARLRRDPRFKDSKIDLLGRYGGMPHLHDPYLLSEAFTRTSLSDIARSVRGAIAAIERVQVSAPR
ncbi:MAG: low molecular weight phosphatase family protein [Sphingorhabdus sp.]